MPRPTIILRSEFAEVPVGEMLVKGAGDFSAEEDVCTKLTVVLAACVLEGAEVVDVVEIEVVEDEDPGGGRMLNPLEKPLSAVLSGMASGLLEYSSHAN